MTEYKLVPSLRQIVTDALVGMVSAVTQTVPPTDEPLPDFIQAPIDRAVTRISAELQSQAAIDIIAERRRQIKAEGWTPKHDDDSGERRLGLAAACYALSAACPSSDETAALLVSLAWPWPAEWWKPTTPRRDLVKAGALILAEIERLDRAATTRRTGR